jgi:NAD(P)-dependent dehydrogenase (short-subunit alcohol dehydrogenase family)
MTERWLEGRRALIVGGGSGIGRGVLDAYLAEGARAAVLEVDPARCQRLSTEVPGVLVVHGDATLAVDCRRVVAETVAALGGLDVLVPCAGVFDFYRGIESIPDDALDAAFDELFAVNVRSVLHCVRAASAHLRRTRGCIVLTGSTSSFYPGRGGILYVASKFAVRGCVTALAHELAPDVRVNGVAPGGTLGTNLTGTAALGLADRNLGDTAGRTAELAARAPLNVALSPQDHAGSYVFLASDRARGITGTFVHSDGGIGVKA